MSSGRLMYVQFTSCVYGDDKKNISKNRIDGKNRQEKNQ